MRQWVIGSTLILGLLGCASQAIEEMNSGLGLAMSQHISNLENALGKPAEVAREGNQTRYAGSKRATLNPVMWKSGLTIRESFEKLVGAVIVAHVSHLPKD